MISSRRASMKHTERFGTGCKPITAQSKTQLKVLNGYERKTSLCSFMTDRLSNMLPTKSPATSQQVKKVENVPTVEVQLYRQLDFHLAQGLSQIPRVESKA